MVAISFVMLGDCVLGKCTCILCVLGLLGCLVCRFDCLRVVFNVGF